jgi:glycerol-3-phosphate dehydrogenase
MGADGYFALVQQVETISSESGLDTDTVTHLLNRYGSMINEILELIRIEPELSEKLTMNLPYVKAEIYYAASHEGALSVEDVISRRTRIAFEAHNHGVDLADPIAEIIAPVLSWGRKECKDSVNAYVTVVNRELAALSELLTEAEKVSS